MKMEKYIYIPYTWMFGNTATVLHEIISRVKQDI